jgi:HEAT repeat protein
VRCIEELAGSEWAQRRELVATLATSGEQGLSALVRALCTRRDDEARIAALVDALVASTGDVERQLFALGDGCEPAILADVAQILGRRRNARAVPTLVRLTRHRDDNVAVAAIEALGRATSHSAVDALVACVESNNFFRTFPAIDVLGRSGDPRAIEPLSRLLANPRYAFEAARALGRTADRGAVGPLVALIDSPSVASVRVACLALSELCERHAERYGVATAVEEGLRATCSSARVRRVGHSLAGADRVETLAICRVFSAWRVPAASHWLLPLLDAETEIARAAGAALRLLESEGEDMLVAALREPHSARRAVLLPMIHKRAQADAVVGCLSDPEASVRTLACEAVARIGYTAATPELFRLLDDESPRVVHAATAAIQSLGSDQTEALALRAARSPRLQTKRAGLRILAYFGPESAYEVFESALSDSDVRVREGAVQGLALLEHPSARALLFELAEQPDVRLRAVAMRALGHAASDSRQLAALRAGLGDPDPWVRYYACQALGKQRDESCVSEVEQLVRDEAGQVRVAAIEALSHLTGDVALRALRLAAGSADLDVKRAALLGLGLARDAGSLDLLCEAALCAEATTRLVALSALASFDQPEVVPALAHAARDGDETVRTAALGYLAAASAPAATTALVALLHDSTEPEPALAALATPSHNRASGILNALESAHDALAPLLASCLSRLGSEAGHSALFRALSLPNRAARLAAAHSLAALGSRAAYAALSRAASDDEDPEVRRVCALHLAS